MSLLFFLFISIGLKKLLQFCVNFNCSIKTVVGNAKKSYDDLAGKKRSERSSFKDGYRHFDRSRFVPLTVVKKYILSFLTLLDNNF